MRRILSVLLMGVSLSVSYGDPIERDPVDPYIDELYQAYCANCHEVEGDAPIAFVPQQWRARLARGENKILDNAINGIGNMPPLGMCMECTEQDLLDLIQYMSQPRQ